MWLLLRASDCSMMSFTLTRVICAVMLDACLEKGFQICRLQTKCMESYMYVGEKMFLVFTGW